MWKQSGYICLIKRAGFPVYKTFEGYSYEAVKLPPAFSREELETLEFVTDKKNLVLYVPVDKDGSQLLFRVISDSYESKSLMLTTNLEFSKWGGIFTDDQMAATMIDRLVYHGHLLIFEGRSYRMEHALMRQEA